MPTSVDRQTGNWLQRYARRVGVSFAALAINGAISACTPFQPFTDKEIGCITDENSSSRGTTVDDLSYELELDLPSWGPKTLRSFGQDALSNGNTFNVGDRARLVIEVDTTILDLLSGNPSERAQQRLNQLRRYPVYTLTRNPDPNENIRLEMVKRGGCLPNSSK